MTEPKYTPQNFIPGFVQNYRTALLSFVQEYGLYINTATTLTILGLNTIFETF